MYREAMATAKEIGISSQEEEIASLKNMHPGRCRVTVDNAEKKSITIQPEDMDITIKFQISARYPAYPALISVRSESLGTEDKDELTQLLTVKGAEKAKTYMIQELVEEASAWLESIGMKPGKVMKLDGSVPRLNNKFKKEKKKKKPEEDEIEEKKSPMKTATDVIHRILWDRNLNKDDFLVGYLDRFLGIIEKYFSVFTWEDIASVDNDVLAIPKHRIHYFKYRNVTVWDKKQRLDNVFGSTGSNITINDIISRYAADEHNQPSSHQYGGATSSYQDAEEDEDSDSDDGIEVRINGAGSYEGVNDEDDVEEEHLSGNSHWQDKLRPNHFLALRVTNKDVQKSVGYVEDFILDHEPLYNSCVIPPMALHVTLCTLGLDTPDQIENAMSTLKNIKKEIVDSRPGQSLSIRGVSNFYNRVVYAKIDHHPEFLNFVDHIKICLREAGVDIRDGYNYVPHMTLMKTTRPVARRKGTKYVEPALYQGFSDMYFGEQEIDSIHLCSMSATRDTDGFYMSIGSIDLE